MFIVVIIKSHLPESDFWIMVTRGKRFLSFHLLFLKKCANRLKGGNICLLLSSHLGLVDFSSDFNLEKSSDRMRRKRTSSSWSEWFGCLRCRSLYHPVLQRKWVIRSSHPDVLLLQFTLSSLLYCSRRDCKSSHHFDHPPASSVIFTH